MSVLCPICETNSLGSWVNESTSDSGISCIACGAEWALTDGLTPQATERPSLGSDRVENPPSAHTVLPLDVDTIDALDPGIRDVVVRLREAGFETTDSGDGVSKEWSERVFYVPHVVCPTLDYRLIQDAERLQGILGPDWRVEGSYCPSEPSAILLAMKGAAEPATCVSTCATCQHLTPFELAPELNTCPVVNIRIHTESAAIFGCNQHEPKAAGR